MGWSLTHVWWIKIREGYLRSKEPSPITDCPAQGSSARKISPHNFWLQKSAGFESVEETSGDQAVPLKEPTHEPTHGLTYSAQVPWWQLEGQWWHSGRDWSVWHHGEQRPLPLFWALPLQSQQAGAISETPSTWLTLSDPSWRSPEPLPHPTYGTTQAAFPYEWMAGLGSCFTNKQQLAPVSSRPSTGNSQFSFTAWLYLGMPQPRTSSSHLR